MAWHASLMWAFDRSMVQFTKRNCVSSWPKSSCFTGVQTMIHRLTLALAILGSMAVAGCGPLGVKPWQRDVLARQEMQLDADRLDAAIDDHLYFSKEASSGG